MYFPLQLKNMISQLFQSRASGARDFEFHGIHFGWKALEDLYRRELGRIRANMLVRVPGLKENHIIRDSWTRLNVKPAKIMQVRLHVHICPFQGMSPYFALPRNLNIVMPSAL